MSIRSTLRFSTFIHHQLLTRKNVAAQISCPLSARNFNVIYQGFRASATHLDVGFGDMKNKGLVHVDFRDFKRAYGLHTLCDIAKALFIFHLCSYNMLVDNSLKLVEWGKRILGRRLFTSVMKSTFYRQFVGGETLADLDSVIKRLQSAGIGPMLCVPIEEDVGDMRDKNLKYDRNLVIITECMQLSGKIDRTYPMSQLKLTALVPGDFCCHLSKIIPDPLKVSDRLDEVVNYLKFQEGTFEYLSDPEKEIMRKSLDRLRTIAELAVSCGVRLVIDAEYTYLNPALRFLSLAMMLAYNTSAPVVAYTYQNYLKATFHELEADEKFIRSREACFGVKLVRGAYMEKERAMATKQGYPDPVHKIFDDTSRMYKKSMDYILEKVAENPQKYFVMVATHNESTVIHALQRMMELSIQPEDGSVFFGQVFGMCDYISFSLGLSGQNIYKSVPYGSVEDTLPYLHRRALENRSVLGGTQVERQLLWKALVNRTSMGLLYK